MTREIRLAGGFMQKVVRVGDTVRRAPRANAAFVRDLLGKLETAGFEGVPRWLGTDAKGREIFSYVEGDVPLQLGHFDDAAICAAARFIRGYHDATAPFFDGESVACHYDLSPCNFAFRDGVPSGIFDFDSAEEAERIFDLGYAAWTWLDIGNGDDYAAEEQLRRLALFAQAYGLEIEIDALIEAILQRQKLLIETKIPLPWHLRHGVRKWARRSREAMLRIAATRAAIRD